MVSLMLKFHDTKPTFILVLIAVSASSINLILIDLSWFYGQAPVKTICPVILLYAPEEEEVIWIIKLLLFLFFFKEEK